MVGERGNRRHRPGRGFEALRYRFEIVSDYGAFRDLQRHRMLTCQWQRLGPDLGAGIPEEVREAGAGDEFERALEISRAEYERLAAAGLREQAPYALCLAYRIRYTLDLNAREAMHLIELRSGREGHPTYRAVAQAMHERIAAIHPGVAAAMELRRHLPGAAPGADPERDPHSAQAGAAPSRRRRHRPASTRSASPQPSRSSRFASSLAVVGAHVSSPRRPSGDAGSSSAFQLARPSRPGEGQGIASPAAQAGGRPPGTQPATSRPT